MIFVGISLRDHGAFSFLGQSMFSDRAKLIAMAIVHVFETSKPFGDFSAVAVLNDGAGVSYGINQFTHRSGSLLTVVNTYLGLGGSVGRDILNWALPKLRIKTPAAISELAGNQNFRNALKAAGRTPEMREAQTTVMENSYLLPAIEACEGSNFRLPLSLAVVYDSINHGSYGRIRDKVTIDRTNFPGDEAFEKAWITEYTRRRDQWLESVPRLATTDYRTDFFLAQIARGNWNLDLPLNVQGVRLTDAMFASDPIALDLGLDNDVLELSAAAPADRPASQHTPESSDTPLTNNLQQTPKVEPPPIQTEPSVTNTVVEQVTKEVLPEKEIVTTTTAASVAAPVEVKKEKPSIFVMIGAGITWLIGIGFNVGSFVQTKLEQMTPQQIGYMVAALGLAALAIYWWQRSAKAAQNRTMQLVEKAADPAQTTVVLK